MSRLLYGFMNARLHAIHGIVFCLLVFIVVPGRVFAILPVHFPLCTGDISTHGFHTQMDVVYSYEQTSVADMGYAGFGVKGVFADNREGRPSWHMAVYGASMRGEQDELDRNNIIRYDVEGYLAGASLTPSMVISNGYSWLKPVCFIGVHVQIQSAEYKISSFDASANTDQFLTTANINGYSDWAESTYYSDRDTEQEVVATGVHTGVQLAMQFDALSLNPFWMVHYSYETIDWDDPFEVQFDEKGNYIMNSIGIHIQLDHPKLSLTAIAQFAREDDGEDAEVYTVMTGISF